MSDASGGAHPDALDSSARPLAASRGRIAFPGQGAHGGIRAVLPAQDVHDGADNLQEAGDAARGAEHQHVFVLEDFCPAFRAKHRLLGEKGRNFHHIQGLSGARLLLKEGPARIVVDAESEDSLLQAVLRTSDLVSTVTADFGRWRKRRPAAGAHGGEVRRQ